MTDKKRDDSLKFGLIGAGVWGKTHAFLYEEDEKVELTAVCDLDQEKAEKLASEFEISHIYTDHQKMLNERELDAVAIVTPDFTHTPLVEDCAEAGKDILLEKPLATTREGVEKSLKAVNDNDVRMMVDLHNRWSPPFALAKERIKKGEIGDPVSAYFRLNDKKWVATDMLSWAEKSSILWFLGSHTIDTLSWLFEDDIKKVYSASHSGVMKKEGIDTTDIYQTILEFQDGGIATIENSWITPNSHPNVNDIKCNVTGDEGIINIDTTNHRMIEVYNQEKHENPDTLVNYFVHGKAKGFAYESIRHFAEKLVSGEDFLVSVEEAAKVSLVILAIFESAEKGEPVKVDYSSLKYLNN